MSSILPLWAVWGVVGALSIVAMASVASAVSLALLCRSLVRKRESLDPEEWYTGEDVAQALSETAKRGLGLDKLPGLIGRRGGAPVPEPDERRSDR